METFSEYNKLYILPVDTDYIVESIDIANGAQTIANQPDVPRNLTITVTDANTSISAGLITITGKDWGGNTVTETLNLASALTKTGTQIFKTVTSVVVSGLVGNEAGDTIIVGIGQRAQVVEGRCLLHSVIVNGGSGTVGSYTIIDNITGTTANVAILKEALTPKTYTYDITLVTGLRVLVAGTEVLTITYRLI